jgi:hypothetical protein
MPDLDAAIRAHVDYARSRLLACDPGPFGEIHVNELADALLAVLEVHKVQPGALFKGGAFCRGDHAHATVAVACCRTLNAIAKALGIEVDNA